MFLPGDAFQSKGVLGKTGWESRKGTKTDCTVVTGFNDRHAEKGYVEDRATLSSASPVRTHLRISLRILYPVPLSGCLE